MSRNGKLFIMVALNTYGERNGTEIRYIKKKIKGCISHDKEFKSYFKILKEFAIEVSVLVRTLQRNRTNVCVYVYLYHICI